MKTLEVNGVEISYRELGTGAPIVFLHAFPLNQTMWDDQTEYFHGDFRVITFDWRGFGRSTPGAGPTTMEIMAEDLAGLLDALTIDRAVICGLSMGGYAAFAFYRQYASRVSALILADTRANSDTSEGKRARYESAETARHRGMSSLVETMLPRLLGESTLRKQLAIVDRVRKMIEGNQPEGAARALEGMAVRADSQSLLPTITCPALVIVGREDKLTPPAEAVKISHGIPGSSFEIIDQAGHLPNIEQPGAFNHVVRRFLNRIS